MCSDLEEGRLPDQLVELRAASRNGGIRIERRVQVGHETILVYPDLAEKCKCIDDRGQTTRAGPAHIIAGAR